jgi:hypothetical protein
MRPIPVFLDTSVLPQNPAHPGIDFGRLCQLADYGLVQVYLSVVVVKEWESHLQEQFLGDLRRARTMVRSCLRHPWSTEINTFIIASADEELDSAIEGAPQIAKRKVGELLERMKAEVLPIKSHHGEIVLQAYFEGSQPFRSRRSRKDFPDAFIFQCASDLIENLGSCIHYIVADEGLADALSKTEGAEVHQSIESFVQSSTVRQVAQEHEEAWQGTLEQLKPGLPTLKDRLREELEHLVEERYRYYPYVAPSGIPSVTGEVIVTEAEELRNVVLEWQKTENVGVGFVGVPFSFECDAKIDFFVYRDDSNSLPKGVRVVFGDPAEDSSFEVQAEVRLFVRGDIALRFDPEQPLKGKHPCPVDISIEKVETRIVVYNN